MNQTELWINGQQASAFVPRRLGSDLNLVFLGADKNAREALASWQPFFDQICTTHPHIDVYHLLHSQPVSGRRLSLGLLNLPRKLLGRRANQTVTVALLTQKGEVLWRSHADYSPEIGGDLCTAIVDAHLIFHGRVAPRHPQLQPSPAFGD